jgi:hypothetical protein
MIPTMVINAMAAKNAMAMMSVEAELPNKLLIDDGSWRRCRRR